MDPRTRAAGSRGIRRPGPCHGLSTRLDERILLSDLDSPSSERWAVRDERVVRVVLDATSDWNDSAPKRSRLSSGIFGIGFGSGEAGA
jgi:hypothetical protein